MHMVFGSTSYHLWLMSGWVFGCGLWASKALFVISEFIVYPSITRYNELRHPIISVLIKRIVPKLFRRNSSKLDD